MERAPSFSSRPTKQEGSGTQRVESKPRYPEHIDPGLIDALEHLPATELETRLIGKGGEHLVFGFEDPKHQDVVQSEFSCELAVSEE